MFGLFFVILIVGIVGAVFLRKNKERRNLFYASIGIAALGLTGAVITVDDDESETPKTVEAEESADNNNNNNNGNISEENGDEVVEEELSREDEIQQVVEEYIAEEIGSTDIASIDVNENFGTGDGSYVVMPRLVWNVQNGADNTRAMLEIQSAKIAEFIENEGGISAVTIFWEVPYHLEGTSAAKFEYERAGGGLSEASVWYAPVIRE